MLVESVGTSLVVGKLREEAFSNMKDASLEKWYYFVSRVYGGICSSLYGFKGSRIFQREYFKHPFSIISAAVHWHLF